VRLLVLNLATDEDDPVLGFAVGWLRALAARVERLDVVTMRGGRADLPANVRVRSLGKERGRSEPARAAVFYRELVDALRARPDACFAHMAALFAAMAGPLLRLRRVPLTLWYARAGSASRTLRVAARFATTVVTPSRESYPLPEGNVVVTGHGIDTQRFSPGEPPAEGFHVLTVGRVAPVKRLEVLIDAARVLRDGLGIGPFSVRVVGPVLPGDEGYAARLRASVADAGLDGVIELLGSATGEALVSLYREAHAFVNLSETDSVDKAALEAMACGVPVVTSNRSLGRIVGEVDARLAVPKGDAAGTAAALARLAAMGSAERAADGLRLREAVVRDHSLERLADRLVGEILAGGG
jgi:glycosyltransferase involved in cell wall biosynthesis